MRGSSGLSETTIVVPTCDRVEEIRTCLASLASAAALTPVPVAEIVVVDNGTEFVAPSASSLDAAPPVRLVRQPTRGASYARNLGLEVARSEIVAFVDDDVVVDDGWLGALVASFRDQAVGAVVGPISLGFRSPRPRWLTPNLEVWFSALNLGPADRLLRDDEHGWGANLAVRRELALAVGGFEPRLGPGTVSGFGDDAELQDRLRDRGAKIAYAADAWVTHVVLGDRLRRRWLMRRAHAEGRTRVTLERIRAGVEPHRQPLKALWSLVGVLVRGLPHAARTLRDPRTRRSVVLANAAVRAAYLGAARERLKRGSRMRPPRRGVGEPAPGAAGARSEAGGAAGPRR